eukprot:gb/GECG01005579.1/.p1 GENE.gb/GECG01005579.1/~~gb/GECG01005579.1/.p1  ORF type:complete len:719 (+),score=52.32 gb/GECG01005579.1/:1-2157(+)
MCMCMCHWYVKMTSLTVLYIRSRVLIIDAFFVREYSTMRIIGAGLGLFFVVWLAPRVDSRSSVEGALKKEFYTALSEAKPCVRLNRAEAYAKYSRDGTNGPVGCTTPRSGIDGLLLPIETEQDLDTFIRDGKSYDRVAVVSPGMLTKTTLDRLRKEASSYFKGVISIPFPLSSSYSPTLKTVFEYVSKDWNPYGNELLQTRYDFPIISTEGSEAESVYNKAVSNRKKGIDSFPQHAVMMYYDMGPEITSDECMEKRYCDALGGQSVWASTGRFFDKNMTTGEVTRDEVIFVMTQLDAPSLFHEKTFGADTTLSGLITTLAAIDALGKTDIRSLPIRILPMAFQGEFFGRLGSQMMFSDIENDGCTSIHEGSNPPWTSSCRSPLQADVQYKYINLTSAKLTIIPDQLGRIDASGQLYDHTHGNPELGHEILEKVVNRNGLQLSRRNPSKPPSPADSLLKHVTDANIITVSPYDNEFINPYYGGQFDDHSNINADNVSSAATILAQTLYALATDDTDPNSAVDKIPSDLHSNLTLVKEILHCTTVSQDCDLFHRILGGVNLPNGPLALYPGLYRQPVLSSDTIQIQASILEGFTRNFLALSISSLNVSCSKDSTCQNLDTTYRCVARQCVEDLSHYHDSYSLAFRATTGFSSKLDSSRVNDMDPVYTEPLWSSAIGARLFITYGFLSEIMPLVIGILVTLASIGAVYITQQYLNKHFKIA